MSHESEDSSNRSVASGRNRERSSLASWLKGLMKEKGDASLRETIEEFIEEPGKFNGQGVSAQERVLLSNILKLRNITVAHIMVPRADIVAVDVGISREDLLRLLAEKQFSRYPVYRETLDDMIGTIHIKDIISSLARNQTINIPNIVTEVPIVSPSLPALDLLMEMQKMGRHIVMVVDEYGGIDGLVTINDVLESIIGEIDDEHTEGSEGEMVVKDDGTVIADGRVSIEEFESRFGLILTDEEREASDTLAGLVFSLAGRIPARGEILTHRTGMVFEVLDADPRRVNRLKIRNIPAS